MPLLRIIGDVHAQVNREELFTRGARPYFELIAGVPYSVQLGDMGDGETYEQLIAHVDAGKHRFFPGNHDHYDRLPPHSLGDFGLVSWGGVEFFFIRGAASADREKLTRLGRERGKTLWFEQEELTDKQMGVAEQAYLEVRPQIVFSHDAPTDIGRLAWTHARQFKAQDPTAVFPSSRTQAFLARLLDQYRPRLWVFGHYHRDWQYREDETLFVCVGELSYIELDAAGGVYIP